MHSGVLGLKGSSEIARIINAVVITSKVSVGAFFLEKEQALRSCAYFFRVQQFRQLLKLTTQQYHAVMPFIRVVE